MCDVDGTDPFTDAWQLCDDDGMVRSGAMHKGTDYPCTGHAHIATPAGRYHIRCTSPAHQTTRVVIVDQGQEHCSGCRCSSAVWLGDGIDLSRMTIYRTNYGYPIPGGM